MSTKDEVLRRMERFGFHTSKALGQNFLIDASALDAIAESTLQHQPTSVIEIGPGPGTLTERLLARKIPLVAVEKDRRLIPLLEEEFRELDNFEVINQDILKVNFQEIVSKLSRPAVAGNIPYNISSPILLLLFNHRKLIGPATLMIQKEVADRLAAKHGNKTYGSLSVLFQCYAEIVRVRNVPAQCFFPPPKVDSTVIRLEWRDTPRVPISSQQHFEKTIRAAFAQRRKTLRNSLRTRFDKEFLKEAEQNSPIDFGRRAETLSIEEFGQLAELLEN